MCFVFVFAALLEYAAVNYTYWGARAKRKNKRIKQKQNSEADMDYQVIATGEAYLMWMYLIKRKIKITEIED